MAPQDVEWTCHKEGMLRKSHRGATSILNPRYFVSDGFHVMYFESEARMKRHGARRGSKHAPWPACMCVPQCPC